MTSSSAYGGTRPFSRECFDSLHDACDGTTKLPSGRDCDCRCHVGVVTTQKCTRCGDEKPYSAQWVETIARKGSKVQWSSLTCWPCYTEAFND